MNGVNLWRETDRREGGDVSLARIKPVGRCRPLRKIRRLVFKLGNVGVGG